MEEISNPNSVPDAEAPAGVSKISNPTNGCGEQKYKV